jgi:hypothetical protein
MADNFNVTPGTGVTIRSIEKNSKKSQVVVLDVGGAGAESLLTVPSIDSTFNGIIFISSSVVNINGYDTINTGGFLIKAHPDNSINIFFVYAGGNSGSGFPLKPSENFIFSGSNLNLLDFGVTAVGSGSVCWAKL